MKKNLLLFLAIANVATVFGATVEKAGIVVEYKKCDKYRSIKENQYCIAILNKSTHPIIVDEELISAPLDSHEKLALTIEIKSIEMNSNIIAAILLSLNGIYISKWLGIPRGALGSSFLGGLGAAAALWKSKQISAIKNKLFHKDITIQPGQLVEKIFWLKDPEAQFEISFDTIKVLK